MNRYLLLVSSVEDKGKCQGFTTEADDFRLALKYFYKKLHRNEVVSSYCFHNVIKDMTSTPAIDTFEHYQGVTVVYFGVIHDRAFKDDLQKVIGG